MDAIVGNGPDPSGRCQEPVDDVPGGVVPREPTAPRAGRRRIDRQLEYLAATGGSNRRRLDARVSAEPELTVWPEPRLVDGSFEGRHLFERSSRRIHREEPIDASAGVVVHEETSAIGRPSQWDRGTLHLIHREVHALPRVEVPDRRPFDPRSFLREEEAAGTRRGRPGDRLHPQVRVDLIARGLTGSAVQDPEGLPVDVAVLGVMDADERAVGRETAAALRPLAPHPGGLRVPVELARGFVPDGHEHPIVLVRREPGRDTPVDQREAHHPSVVEASEERPGVATFERRHHPPPALVPDLVVPPHDARSVGDDVRFLRADTTM